MKVNVKKILKILLIFMILQPIFDILSFFNIRDIISLPISTYVKPLFVFGIVVYIVIKDHNSIKKWVLYLLLFVVYSLIHCFLLMNLSIPTETIFNEARFLLNILYMISLIFIYWYIYYNYKDKEEMYHSISKSLILTFLIYTFIVLISVISDTSYLTYEIADKAKLGFKGWFDSGQILGHATIMVAPFYIVYVVNKNHLNSFVKFIFLSILVFFIFMVGTKTPYYISFLMCISLIIAIIFIKFFSKKRINKFLLFVLLLIPFLGSLLFEYLPVYHNINLNELALTTPLKDYINTDKPEDPNNDITGSHGNKLTLELYDKTKNDELLDYYEWSNITSDYLQTLYDSGKLHPADTREKQFYFSFKLFSLSDIEYKLFGIGYLNQAPGLSIESDFFMGLFCFGIFGFILMLFIPIMEFLKTTIYMLFNLRKLDVEIYALYIGLGIFFAISIYAGYTFLYTNFSIFLVTILILLKLKVRLTAGNIILINLNEIDYKKNKNFIRLLSKDMNIYSLSNVKNNRKYIQKNYNYDSNFIKLLFILLTLKPKYLLSLSSQNNVICKMLGIEKKVKLNDHFNGGISEKN